MPDGYKEWVLLLGGNSTHILGHCSFWLNCGGASSGSSSTSISIGEGWLARSIGDRRCTGTSIIVSIFILAAVASFRCCDGDLEYVTVSTVLISSNHQAHTSSIACIIHSSFPSNSVQRCYDVGQDIQESSRVLLAPFHPHEPSIEAHLGALEGGNSEVCQTSPIPVSSVIFLPF